MTETFITADGLKRLQEELNTLKSVRRIQIAERIKQAIEYGDISENSEYDDAKNEQAFIEGKVLELENKIRTAKIIDENTSGSATVRLGSKITLEDVSNGEQMTFTLVGSAEADPLENKISNESPVGAAILGKEINKTEPVIVKVKTPSGQLTYRVLPPVE